jgi:hypothetical protein
MDRQPVEQLPLGAVCCQIPDQGAFGRVPAEFLQLNLIVLHGMLSALELAVAGACYGTP